MVRHVALFRFRPDLSEQDVTDLLAGFAHLVDRIDGFRGVHFGRNISPEQLDQGFRHGIIADFDDMDSLKSYLADSAHVRLADRVLAALATGVERDVIVFDLEFADRP